MRLTKARIDRISDILQDIAQVAFASLVIQFFIDRFDLNLLVLGIILSILSWSISIYIIKK